MRGCTQAGVIRKYSHMMLKTPKKLLTSSFVWGIAAAMISVIVSAAIALIFPSNIRFASESSPPKVGQVYTKKEIDAREQLARKRLEEVRKDYSRGRFGMAIRSDMANRLPFIVIVVLVLIIGIKRHFTFGSLFLITVPSVLIIAMTRVGSLLV